MKLLSYILTILLVFCGTDCYARPVTGNIEGHDYVDLGLPSGLKWATCNVGATSPEECGDSFAWGEVKTKKDFTKDSSFTTFQSAGRLQKRGVIDSYGVLTAMCDAATQNWGDKWRMPTKEEFDELTFEDLENRFGDKLNGEENEKITDAFNNVLIDDEEFFEIVRKTYLSCFKRLGIIDK